MPDIRDDMEHLPADILGQSRALKLLRSYLTNDTIPHAFIFLGPDGVGKKTTARFFAMALNCLDPSFISTHGNGQTAAAGAQRFGCGQCRACRLIAQTKHPDILYLAPEGAFIKVDQIRRLINALSLKPVEARTRVVIMEDVQHLNPAAANALLKTLEEPYPATIFMLTAPGAAEVMPTILSRCQRVTFQPLTADTMQMLLPDYGAQIQNKELIAYLSGGSLSRARELLKPESIRRRGWLLNEMSALPKAAPARILSLANELNKNKRSLDFELNIMLSWFKDVLALKINGAEIINRDFMTELQYNSTSCTLERAHARLTLVQNALAALTGANVNPRLGLEHLLLALK